MSTDRTRFAPASVSSSPSMIGRRVSLSGDRSVTLTEKRGRGSNASVYVGDLADAYGGQRKVAVKFFDTISGDGRARTLAAIAPAVEAAARIVDRNVVSTLDYDLKAEVPFVVNELVNGVSLRTAIAEHVRREVKPSFETAIVITLAVAEGLAAALNAKGDDRKPLGFVHGLLSSRDVLLSWDGDVKVSDFGLGRASIGSSMSRPQASGETIAWMAPELARGESPSARADVFSLGILLHEMLVGPRFLPQTTPVEAMYFVRDGVVHRNLFEMQLLGPARALLNRAIAPDPHARYESAAAMLPELRRLLELFRVGDTRACVRGALSAVRRPAADPSVAHLEGMPEADAFAMSPSARISQNLPRA